MLRSFLVPLFVILCLLSAARGVLCVTWVNCGTQSSPVGVSAVSMTPDPALAGSNFSITLSANASQQLSGGTMYVMVTLWGIPVFIESSDLCSRVECPILNGEFSLVNKQWMPGVTPLGTYKVRISAYDVSRRQLFCSLVTMKVEKPPPSWLDVFRTWHPKRWFQRERVSTLTGEAEDMEEFQGIPGFHLDDRQQEGLMRRLHGA